jgi:ribosomal protein L40E
MSLTARERYQRLKDDGICVGCGAARAEPDAVSCRSCLDAVNARRRGRSKQSSYSTGGSFNVCCQAVGFHRIDCETVREPKRKVAMAPSA